MLRGGRCNWSSDSAGSGGAPLVAVMKPSDLGQLHDLAHRRRLDVSRIGRIFVQGEVGSRALVVGEVGTQDAAKMCLAKDDHVIKALAADRTDKALDVRILPGRPGSDEHFGDLEPCHPALEVSSVDAIAIA